MIFIDRLNKEKGKETYFSLFDNRELKHLMVYRFQTFFAEMCILSVCIIVVISNTMVSKPISNEIH